MLILYHPTRAGLTVHRSRVPAEAARELRCARLKTCGEEEMEFRYLLFGVPMAMNAPDSQASKQSEDVTPNDDGDDDDHDGDDGPEG